MRWIWLLAICAAVIVAAIAWMWWFGPVVPPAIDPRHEERAVEAEKNVEAKDATIRGLSAEIARLRAEADRQGQARAQAEQRAGTFASRAAELGQQVARLETAAKTRPAIDSRARALTVLQGLGYE